MHCFVSPAFFCVVVVLNISHSWDDIPSILKGTMDHKLRVLARCHRLHTELLLHLQNKILQREMFCEIGRIAKVVNIESSQIAHIQYMRECSVRPSGGNE